MPHGRALPLTVPDGKRETRKRWLRHHAVDCRQVVPAVSGTTDERKGKLRFNG
jgi:hypothetical protein